MKTKLLILTALIVGLMFLVMPVIYAEDAQEGSDATSLYDDTSDIPEGMVISPSPVATDDLDETESTNGLKLGWERFRIALTFNQEKKAQLELELARLQLIRAKIAARNNNSDAVENALEAHERIMNRVQSRVEAIKAKNLSEDKLIGLDNAIQVHEERIAKIGDILASADLTDAQRARVQERLTNVESVTSKLRFVQEEAEALQEIKKAYGDMNKSEMEQAAKQAGLTVQQYVVQEEAKLIQARKELNQKNS